MTASYNSNRAKKPSIGIIGAGIMGLACAWELSRRGANVAIHDKAWPPRGASWAAAGMLAPAYEVAAQNNAHARLLELCMASASLWPRFATDLEAASGLQLGYRPGPSLTVATTSAEVEKLDELSARLSSREVPYTKLTGEQALSVEPTLTRSVLGAIELSTDGQVDNRAVVDALIAACKLSGARRVAQKPDCNIMLETVGWQAKGNRPVKGQLLSLTPIEDGPKHVINEGTVYIVPKGDRIVIGATSEPDKADTIAETRATERLRRRAINIVPALSNADVLERWAGVRPATTDYAPVFANPAPHQFTATGHYRNGILLAPVTAQIMADMILDGYVSDLAAAFSPDRFASVG